MRIQGTSLGLALLALAFGPPAASAGDAAPPGILRGRLPEGGSVRFGDRTVAAGPDGSFEIPGIPAGGRYDLEILPPEGATGAAPLLLRDLEMPLRGDRNLGDLRWRPGRPCVLRVTDPAGRPLPGARIGVHWGRFSYRWKPGEFPLERPRQPSMEALTGADGIARFVRLPPGPWEAMVTMPGRPTATVDLGRHLEGPDLDAKVILPEACSLRGTVRDHRGHPLPGVVVIEGQAISYPIDHPRAVTDASGRYLLEGLRPGAVHLNVIPGADRHAAAGVFVVPGVREADLEVGGDAVVRGRVVDDADGSPLPGVAVRFCVAMGGEFADLVLAESGPDGRFEVAGLESSRLVRSLSAERAGFAHVDPYGGPKLDPAGEIAVRMRRIDSTIQGRVVGPWGFPVPGIRLRVHQPKLSSSWHTGYARTRADGTFRVPAIAGPAELHVDGDGYFQPGPGASRPPRRDGSRPPPRPDSVIVPAGGTATVGIAVIPSGTFRGSVVAPDGNPVPRVVVHSQDWFGRTDEGGRFEIRRATPGRRTNLEVDDHGWTGTAGPFQVGSGGTIDGIRIVVRRKVELRGVVLTADRKPVEGAGLEVVYVNTLGGGSNPLHPWTYAHRRIVTGEGGCFTLEDLSTPDSREGGDPSRKLRPFRFVARVAGFAPTVVTIPDLAAGTRTAEVAVILSAGRVLEGFVSALDGRPLEGVRVRMRLPAPGFGKNEEWHSWDPVVAVTAAGGTFTVRDLPEGNWEVLLQARGYLDRTLTCGPGARADAALEPDAEKLGVPR